MNYIAEKFLSLKGASQHQRCQVVHDLLLEIGFLRVGETFTMMRPSQNTHRSNLFREVAHSQS